MSDCVKGTKADIKTAEAVAEAVVRVLGLDVEAHRARRDAAKANHAAKFGKGGRHV